MSNALPGPAPFAPSPTAGAYWVQSKADGPHAICSIPQETSEDQHRNPLGFLFQAALTIILLPNLPI